MLAHMRASKTLLKLPGPSSHRWFSGNIPWGSILEESLSRYRPGGYHPVRIGDVFNHGQYRVLCKLGYGKYSTVWLAHDNETKHHVALKILTADSFGQGKHTFELDILKHIQTYEVLSPGAAHVLDLLDDFKHLGPHGEHVCLVFKPMGPDLAHFRRLFPNLRLPMRVLKDITRQLLLALSFLHGSSMRVIHTDIKPRNILVETPAIDNMFAEAPSAVFLAESPLMSAAHDFYMESVQLSSNEEDLVSSSKISVRLTDFGTSSWVEDHLVECIQPEMLRAPEVTLGAKWDYKADIWNLGLVIWELAEGSLLFDGMAMPEGPYSPDAHLAQMSAVLGRFPDTLLSRSTRRGQYFDVNGNLLQPSQFPPCSLELFSKSLDHSEDEKTKFLSFIKSMIMLDPRRRPSAEELLRAEWLGADK